MWQNIINLASNHMDIVTTKGCKKYPWKTTPFKNGILRWGWLWWFNIWNPNMSLQIAHGLEIRCTKGLCLANVKSLHTNLFKVYLVHKYPLSKIWNYDEFGAQASQNGGTLVLAQTNSWTMHSTTLIEHKWLLMLSCINVVFPNLYIFKGKHFTRNFIAQYELGATMMMQPKATMTTILFNKWISHFITSIQNFGGNLNPTNFHLFILDAHNLQVPKCA